MVNDGILFYLVYRLGPFVMVPLIVLFVFALYVLVNPWTWVVLGLLYLVAASAERLSHGSFTPEHQAEDADPNTTAASVAQGPLPVRHPDQDQR